MHARLRMPDDLYQHEIGLICLPRWSLLVLRDAVSGPWADPGFDSHVREFLTLNYQAPAHLMEDAFQALQHDLLQGRVLITERMTRFPAFFWIPPKDDQAGYWLLGYHVHAEHRSILQLALDNARADVPNASVDGATESQSTLGRAFDTAKGAAKQFANDLMRRNAALNAQWQAENGMATFTDKATGNVLSPDEVKERWEAEGKDVLPIEGADQQQGAQAVKDAPAMGAAAEAAMILGSKGRSAIRNPDDVVDGVGDLVKGIRKANAPKTEYAGKYKGEVVILKNIEVKEISYTRRSRESLDEIRKQFDSSARKNFLKSIGNDPEKISAMKSAGFSDAQIEKISKGGVPKGYNVHHKIPIDDGGTNEFSNLVLIRNNAEHYALTNAQRELTSHIPYGQTEKIEFPIPPGFLYPM